MLLPHWRWHCEGRAGAINLRNFSTKIHNSLILWVMRWSSYPFKSIEKGYGEQRMGSWRGEHDLMEG
jgi:hypothetical protein